MPAPMANGDRPGHDPTPASTAELVRALIVVVAVLAAVIAVVAWVVLTFVVRCGCTTPA